MLMSQRSVLSVSASLARSHLSKRSRKLEADGYVDDTLSPYVYDGRERGRNPEGLQGP